MRATDLLGMAVYDNAGNEVGSVRDLRFEARGGAVAGSGQPAYRLIEIECGAVGLAHRLGYGHRDLAGPWTLDRVLARLARRSLLVRWEQIRSIGGARIDLNVAAGQLRRLGDPDHD